MSTEAAGPPTLGVLRKTKYVDSSPFAFLLLTHPQEGIALSGCLATANATFLADHGGLIKDSATATRVGVLNRCSYGLPAYHLGEL